MNSFKRGEEPLKALDIGTIANAPYIDSLYLVKQGFDYERGLVWEDKEYVGDSLDVLGYLSKVQDGEIDPELFYISTGTDSLEESTIRLLSHFKGMYLKYIYYPKEMAITWSDSIGPKEFTFKIPQ